MKVKIGTRVRFNGKKAGSDSHWKKYLGLYGKMIGEHPIIGAVNVKFEDGQQDGVWLEDLELAEITDWKTYMGAHNEIQERRQNIIKKNNSR